MTAPPHLPSALHALRHALSGRRLGPALCLRHLRVRGLDRP